MVPHGLPNVLEVHREDSARTTHNEECLARTTNGGAGGDRPPMCAETRDMVTKMFMFESSIKVSAVCHNIRVPIIQRIIDDEENPAKSIEAATSLIRKGLVWPHRDYYINTKDVGNIKREIKLLPLTTKDEA